MEQKNLILGFDFGDDPNDFMAKCGAKWLHKNGVNVLCMSPGKKNYSHVNYPLERIETAIQWLMSNGNRKVGIMGMRTAGMDAIVAASNFLPQQEKSPSPVEFITLPQLGHT